MHYYLVKVGGKFAPADPSWELVSDVESARRFSSWKTAKVVYRFWRTQTELDVALLGPFMEDAE